jgi:DNA-binding beta-propeller fold protein YncE
MLESPPRRRRLKIVLPIVIGLLLLVSALAYYQNSQTSGGVSSSQTLSTASSGATSSDLLALSGKISLAMTQGRIDHMAIDLQKGLLFVAALGNNSMGIVDIHSGLLIKSVTGLSSPQGVAFDPGNGKLYVSNAGDGTLSVFDSRNFALLERISFPGGDADNLRLDATNRLLYVGYGSGGIAMVNTTSDKIIQEFPLPGHPEAFEVQEGSQTIFVNLPTANIVEAINISSGRSAFNHKVSANSANFPMALDETDGRLFIATRNPSELMVFDTSTPSLRSVANVTIAGDPDDIFYDSARGLVYVSCGQGSLEVIKQADPNHYSMAQTISTAPGARTSLFVPELASIYVAAPAGTGKQAGILVYGFDTASVSSTSASSSIAPIPAAASLSVTPPNGPSGLVVTLAGSGYVPEVTYQVCVAGNGNTTCGFRYVAADYPASIGKFATLGSFVADSAGGIPAGTKVTIPDLFGGGYLIGVVPDGNDAFFVSMQFNVESPTLSAGAATVVANANVTLTGSGYAPSTTYTACFVRAGTVDCGYTGDREEAAPGIYVGTFTADPSGNIPSGTNVNIPLQPNGRYAIGIFIPSGGFILISEVQFTVTVAG